MGSLRIQKGRGLHEGMRGFDQGEKTGNEGKGGGEEKPDVYLEKGSSREEQVEA